MFGHETRPTHFFIPTIIVIIGGIFTHIEGWEYVGYIIWGVALANIFWLIYTTIKDNEFRKIREAHDHYAEITKLDAAKTKTRVVIDKTSIEGNYFSQSYTDLRIAPAKLKLFAERVLDGKKLTIRDWTPIKDGKLFSDGEWRRLIAFMKQPVKDRPDIKFITQINPNEERLGFDLTPTGREWLEDVIDLHVLTPH